MPRVNLIEVAQTVLETKAMQGVRIVVSEKFVTPARSCDISGFTARTYSGESRILRNAYISRAQATVLATRNTIVVFIGI